MTRRDRKCERFLSKKKTKKEKREKKKRERERETEEQHCSLPVRPMQD